MVLVQEDDHPSLTTLLLPSNVEPTNWSLATKTAFLWQPNTLTVTTSSRLKSDKDSSAYPLQGAAGVRRLLVGDKMNAVIKPQGREVVMLASPALRPNQDTGNAVLVIENSPWHSAHRTNDAATIPGIVRMGCITIPVYGKIYQLNQRQVALMSQDNPTLLKV
jgi:hypothetical protein